MQKCAQLCNILYLIIIIICIYDIIIAIKLNSELEKEGCVSIALLLNLWGWPVKNIFRKTTINWIVNF